MKFTIAHNNYNVRDLEKSIAFYEEAFGLKVVRNIDAPDGSFKIVFLSGEGAPHRVELTWLRDHPQPYDLGENEYHLALATEDMEAAHAFHEQMGIIIYENPQMGIYFVGDPDGYWVEVIPQRRP